MRKAERDATETQDVGQRKKAKTTFKSREIVELFLPILTFFFWLEWDKSQLTFKNAKLSERLDFFATPFVLTRKKASDEKKEKKWTASVSGELGAKAVVK